MVLQFSSVDVLFDKSRQFLGDLFVPKLIVSM